MKAPIPEFTMCQSKVRLSAKKPIRVQRRMVTTPVRPHDHDYFEICLVLDGAGTHFCEASRQPLGKGSILVAGPGETHAFENILNLKVVNIYYLAEWLLFDLQFLWDMDGLIRLFLASSLFPDIPIPGIYQFRLQKAELDKCLSDIKDLEKELQVETPSSMYLKSCFMKLLIQLSRAYLRDNPQKLRLDFRKEVWVILNEIERLLTENKGFSLNQVAKTVGLAPDYTSKIFKNAIGWSLMEYYQRRRMQYACSLLLNPELRTSEVAYKLGFSDAAHFSRLFRKTMGISPRSYRQIYL